MPKPTLRLVSPTTVKRKVTPRRPKNGDVRTREYLTESEIERLIRGCEGNRWPHRDQTMILLTGRELRALRRLHREAEGRSPFLFLSERGSPMTVSNFQKLINRATEAASLKIKCHPHMLRHACGFHQANRDTRSLQAYLGHKNIQHTVRYTELAPTRFKGWWKD